MKNKNITKIVSIRCRRHKKRFNVESHWLDTSEWLCPKCYGKLKPNERLRYAPRKGEKPEVREAEKGKPTILPDIYGYIEEVRTAKKESCCDGIRKDESYSLIDDFIDKGRNKRIRSIYKKKNTRADTSCSSSFKNSNTKLKDLLPRYNVHCLKCGEVVPCHGFWLEKSSVLCPSCASSMSDEEVDSFNREHSAKEIQKPSVNKKDIVKNGCTKSHSENDDKSEKVSYCIGCSENFIHKATELELLEAMKEGRLSKVRYRIEMKRRENTDWYDGCHEDEERAFGKI